MRTSRLILFLLGFTLIGCSSSSTIEDGGELSTKSSESTSEPIADPEGLLAEMAEARRKPPLNDEEASSLPSVLNAPLMTGELLDELMLHDEPQLIFITGPVCGESHRFAPVLAEVLSDHQLTDRVANIVMNHRSQEFASNFIERPPFTPFLVAVHDGEVQGMEQGTVDDEQSMEEMIHVFLTTHGFVE